LMLRIFSSSEYSAQSASSFDLGCFASAARNEDQ
jgi:hypothetical protein